MVVTSLPSARDTGATQDRIASPLRWTVQAPHCAMPQPYLVPVKPRFSRRTQSRGVEGSTSRLTRCRFTLNKIIGTLLKASEVAILKQGKNVTPICTVSPYDAPARPIRPESGLSGTSLHQSLEGGASFGDLREAGVRTFKVRKKFLILVDGLVAFSGALVDLAEI